MEIWKEADYHQGYINGWRNGRDYREGNKLRTPRWSQEKIKPDDVCKHYAQGYVNGYSDGREGVSCNPAGEIEEGWDFPLPPLEDEF